MGAHLPEPLLRAPAGIVSPALTSTRPRNMQRGVHGPGAVLQHRTGDVDTALHLGGPSEGGLVTVTGADPDDRLDDRVGVDRVGQEDEGQGGDGRRGQGSAFLTGCERAVCGPQPVKRASVTAVSP